MQYLLLLYADEKGWAKMSPKEMEQAVAAYAAYTQAVKEAGVWVGSNRLRSVSDATSVTTQNGKSRVLDGPFADSKEQLGGYYLIEAADLDEATAIAARVPGARDGSIEVRPIFAM